MPRVACTVEERGARRAGDRRAGQLEVVLGRGAHVRAGGAAAVALAAGHELAAARAVVLGADQGALAAERARAIDRREVRVRGADELTN